MRALFRQQPPAFYMIFMVEMWERFGFYAMQGVLTLYFIRKLGFDDKDAYFTFGAFTALVYGLVAAGGYLGDSILGTRRTMVFGLVTLAGGYLALSLASEHTVFYALGLVCVGNGLFKANPSNLLAKCYEKNDPRLHGGFTLYYMSVNIASTFALLAGPAIATGMGYFYVYFASFVGLLLGIANYFARRQSVAHLDIPLDRKPVSWRIWMMVVTGVVIITFLSAWLLQHILVARNLAWVAAAVVLVMYAHFMRQEDAASRRKMLVALVLMLEAQVFFVLYQQMPTSLNLFAVNNVVPVLFGISIDPQSFQGLNPLWIILMSPVLAHGYARLYHRGLHFDTPYKFALGMTLCGTSFLLLYFARYFHDEAGFVSSWWLVASYFFQCLGELLVSALGVAMVAELVPAKITGFVMGMWFLSQAVSGFIGASVASLTALPQSLSPGVDSLNVYTTVFAEIGLVTLAIALLLWGVAPALSRYSRNV